MVPLEDGALRQELSVRKLTAGMAHRIEPARTSRGHCRVCGQMIARGAPQLVEEQPSAFSSRGTPRRMHLDCALRARPAQLREALLAHAGPLQERAELLEQLALQPGEAPEVELPFAERLEAPWPCSGCGGPIERGALAIAVEGEGPPHLHLRCARRAGLGDLEEALIRSHSRGLAPGDLELVAEVLHAQP